jgi:hypothetical protein
MHPAATLRDDPAELTPRVLQHLLGPGYLGCGLTLETRELEAGCTADMQGASLENLQLTPKPLDPPFDLFDRPTGVVKRSPDTRPDHGSGSFRESAQCRRPR